MLAFLTLMTTIAVSGPAIGQPAPEIVLTQTLQAKPGARATLKDLRGKVIVLEFWATWCGPCRDAIPHMNSLQDKLQRSAKDKIVFIAITDENPKLVKSFLTKNPILGWIGIDGNKHTARNYGVRGIPTTMIIGKDGRLLANTSPLLVTESMLLTAFEKGTLSAPSNANQSQTPLIKGAFYTASVTKTAYPLKASYQRTDELIDIRNAPLSSLLSYAYNVPTSRIDLDIPMLQERYDVYIRMPRPEASYLAEAFQHTLRSAFSLTVERKRNRVEVGVLRTDGGRYKNLQVSKYSGSGSSSSEYIFGDGVPISWALTAIENRLGIPTIDETGLNQDFNYRFKIPASSKEAFIKAFKDQFGLILSFEPRDLERLVVRVRPQRFSGG